MYKYAGIADKVIKILSTGAKSAKDFTGLHTLKNYYQGAEKAFSEGAGVGKDYLKNFARPEISKVNGKFVSKDLNAPGVTGDKAGIVQRTIGSTVRELEFLGKDLSSSKSFTDNAFQFGKNVVDDISRQLTNARYRTISSDTVGTKSKQVYNKITKNNKEYLIKNKGFSLGKREILGTTEKGDFIVKKRLPMQAIALTATPIGMAALSTAGGEPKEGAKEYFAWKTPIGPTKMMYDLIKPGEQPITDKKIKGG